jgi:hypothetical protein
VRAPSVRSRCQAHEHGPVQDVHVLAGDLHRFVAVAGTQGSHKRDVVAV